MDELLALILGEIAEFFLEALLELIAAAVLALVSRALLGLFRGVAEAVHRNRVLMVVFYALLGALAGTLSLLVLPHPLLHHEHPSRFHGISVLISPIFAGLVLSAFGGILRRLGKKVTPIETFNYGFRIRARNGASPIVFREIGDNVDVIAVHSPFGRPLWFWFLPEGHYRNPA